MWACSWAASRKSCWVLASPTGWPSTTTTRPPGMLTNKIVSADEAVAVIRDGDTVCSSGFVGIGTPDELILALERRYLQAGQPSGLTLVFAAAPGDGQERGLNRLAHAGLLKRVVGGHWSLVPKIGALALDNAIEAYNLPLGCISRLYREIAARGPGLLSKVGLARARHRPGRAHCGGRVLEPARGADLGRAGGLRGRSRAREPSPDLRDGLQPRLLGPSAGAARPGHASAPGRAQDRGAPVRLRAAARRRREPRHRHARERGGGRGRGEGAQIRDAHGGAGRDRRAAPGRAQLRGGPQPRSRDPPELAVRLLRRWRAR